MDWMIIVSLLVGAVVLFYVWVQRRLSYWANKGVPGPKPAFLVGNMATLATSNPFQLEKSWHGQFGDVYGHYNGLRPVLTVADPELIKQIWVRDFPLFVNGGLVNIDHEIFNIILFASENENWRRLRSIVTPNFTTGKLRALLPLMKVCLDKYVVHLDRVVAEKGGRLDNVKEAMTGFAIDVITTTSFATVTNADQENNPFVYYGVRFFNVSAFRLVAAFAFPKWLNRLIGIRSIFNDETSGFFINTVKQIIRDRKAKGGEGRKDLLQWLINFSLDETELAQGYDKLAVNDHNDTEIETTTDAKKSKSSTQRHLSENELIAQCLAFFLAGYESTSGTLTYVLHTLVQRPDIQERLYKELEENLAGREDVDSKEYYDLVMSLPYLEGVIKETLRMYPPVPRIQRRLTNAQQYNLAGITIEHDQMIEIPTIALHYNPVYWPEPEVFRPERFLPENRDQLNPYAFLPFSTGPRNCVGMRFALQESKFSLARLLLRYRFKATPETPAKMHFKSGAFLLVAEHFPCLVERR